MPAHIWDYSASMLDELHRIEGFRPIDVVQCPNWDSEGLAAVLEGHFRNVVGLYTPLRTVLRVDPAMRAQAESAPEAFGQILGAESLVYEQADGFLACGPAIVEEVEAAYGVTFPRDRLGTVAHGLADEAAGHSPAPGAGPPRLLFVGRLEARKGIDTLLESAAALAATGVPTSSFTSSATTPWSGRRDRPTARISNGHTQSWPAPSGSSAGSTTRNSGTST